MYKSGDRVILVSQQYDHNILPPFGIIINELTRYNNIRTFEVQVNTVNSGTRHYIFTEYEIVLATEFYEELYLR